MLSSASATGGQQWLKYCSAFAAASVPLNESLDAVRRASTMSALCRSDFESILGDWPQRAGIQLDADTGRLYNEYALERCSDNKPVLNILEWHQQRALTNASVDKEVFLRQPVRKTGQRMCVTFADFRKMMPSSSPPPPPSAAAVVVEEKEETALSTPLEEEKAPTVPVEASTVVEVAAPAVVASNDDTTTAVASDNDKESALEVKCHKEKETKQLKHTKKEKKAKASAPPQQQQQKQQKQQQQHNNKNNTAADQAASLLLLSQKREHTQWYEAHKAKNSAQKLERVNGALEAKAAAQAALLKKCELEQWWHAEQEDKARTELKHKLEVEQKQSASATNKARALNSQNYSLAHENARLHRELQRCEREAALKAVAAKGAPRVAMSPRKQLRRASGCKSEKAAATTVAATATKPPDAATIETKAPAVMMKKKATKPTVEVPAVKPSSSSFSKTQPVTLIMLKSSDMMHVITDNVSPNAFLKRSGVATATTAASAKKKNTPQNSRCTILCDDLDDDDVANQNTVRAVTYDVVHKGWRRSEGMSPLLKQTLIAYSRQAEEEKSDDGGVNTKKKKKMMNRRVRLPSATAEHKDTIFTYTGHDAVTHMTLTHSDSVVRVARLDVVTDERD